MNEFDRWKSSVTTISSSPKDTAYGDFIIDRARFRHYAPAELHPYHATFDLLYREWLGREHLLERSGVSRHKVSALQIVTAALAGNTIEIPLGDPIPVVEMMIELHPGGEEVMKVMPRHLLRPVSDRDWVNSGGRRVYAKDTGSIVTKPTCIMQVTKMASDGISYSGIRHSFGCALSFLFKYNGARKAGPIPTFTAYCHSFGDAEEEEEPNFIYYGITQRAWQQRWAEHRRAIERGSPLKFHRTFNEEVRSGRATNIHHEVVAVAGTRDEILETEETLVAGILGDPYCLNMIPGGKAGFAYMHEHGMLGSRRKEISIDARDSLLEDWLQAHPREGLPAPWVADRWVQNEAWAASFVCSVEGRLSVEQVQRIRHLSAGGKDTKAIQTEVGARTLSQVKGVIEGRTYNRVPIVI